jgi:hypothetical protein
MKGFFSPQAECDIRDFGKKVHNLEIEFDETNDKLNKVGRTCVYTRMGQRTYNPS